MQCPFEFAAVAAMVIAAAVIGAGCGIKPKQKDDWLVVPNLWGGIVARPSMLKTPLLAEMMKPLARLELAAKGRPKNGIPAPRMEDVKQRYLDLEEPEALVRRRFKTNDSTIEKLGELMNENPRGVLLFRDELIGLLCSWDREDRSFYLEAWKRIPGVFV